MKSRKFIVGISDNHVIDIIFYEPYCQLDFLDNLREAIKNICPGRLDIEWLTDFEFKIVAHTRDISQYDAEDIYKSIDKVFGLHVSAMSMYNDNEIYRTGERQLDTRLDRSGVHGKAMLLK